MRLFATWTASTARISRNMENKTLARWLCHRGQITIFWYTSRERRLLAPRCRLDMLVSRRYWGRMSARRRFESLATSFQLPSTWYSRYRNSRLPRSLKSLEKSQSFEASKVLEEIDFSTRRKPLQTVFRGHKTLAWEFRGARIPGESVSRHGSIFK